MQREDFEGVMSQSREGCACVCVCVRVKKRKEFEEGRGRERRGKGVNKGMVIKCHNCSFCQLEMLIIAIVATTADEKKT